MKERRHQSATRQRNPVHFIQVQRRGFGFAWMHFKQQTTTFSAQCMSLYFTKHQIAAKMSEENNADE